MPARHEATGGPGLSKQQQSRRPAAQQATQQPQQPQQAQAPPQRPAVALPQTTTGEQIEIHRRCPICWEGRGGYGLAYSTQGQTRYYRCCKSDKPGLGPCGHTWSVRVQLQTIVIQHKVVSIDGER
jgi:hypothetical protein